MKSKINYPFRKIKGGEVAQSVEQGTENPRVHSSILCLATIFLPFSGVPDQHFCRILCHMKCSSVDSSI